MKLLKGAVYYMYTYGAYGMSLKFGQAAPNLSKISVSPTLTPFRSLSHRSIFLPVQDVLLKWISVCLDCCTHFVVVLGASSSISGANWREHERLQFRAPNWCIRSDFLSRRANRIRRWWNSGSSCGGCWWRNADLSKSPRPGKIFKYCDNLYYYLWILL